MLDKWTVEKYQLPTTRTKWFQILGKTFVTVTNIPIKEKLKLYRKETLPTSYICARPPPHDSLSARIWGFNFQFWVIELQMRWL